MTIFKLNALDAIFVALYMLLMIGVVGGMLYARSSAMATFASDETQAEWEDWRSAVQHGETNMGTVQRRVPRSEEPPTLVLLRDYFVTCLVGLAVLTSLVYGSFVFLLRGVLHGAREGRLGKGRYGAGGQA